MPAEEQTRLWAAPSELEMTARPRQQLRSAQRCRRIVAGPRTGEIGRRHHDFAVLAWPIGSQLKPVVLDGELLFAPEQRCADTPPSWPEVDQRGHGRGLTALP